MSFARAVIGANFGDEGKGLMTDYLATVHQSDLVVRFNGGSQAGHTVVTPDGRRHVFSHFGSGCFAGAATLLSRFFILNPMIFLREYMELSTKLPPNMDVIIDPEALVSTPFDMLLNQMAEMKRDGNRHGSCGLGIGETVERSEKFMKITASDLKDEARLREMLVKVRDEWVPLRKFQLGLGDDQDHILKSALLIDNYLSDVRFMMEQSKLQRDVVAIRAARNPVFEGAQGLLLDQGHEWFPHVTRSNTGIINVLKLLSEAGIREVEVYYMTRAYLTRHGAGPLPKELGRLPFPGVVDETNIINEWQGSLRFAYLDTDLLRKTILKDLAKNNYTHIKVRARLAITCLDQVDDENADEIGNQIAIETRMFGNHFKSFGPTRDHIVDHQLAGDRKIEEEAREAARALRAKKKKRAA
jgi:adenylosuccinate synthase